MTAFTLPSAFDVAACFLKSPTCAVTSVIPAFFKASFIALSTFSLVRSLDASISAIAVETTAFASATFSASVFGSFAIVLLNVTVSLTSPHVITTLADTLPSEAEVASFLEKSPTVIVTSVTPVEAAAASAIFLITSCEILLLPSVFTNSDSTAFLTKATFCASVFSGSTTGFCVQCA